MAAPSVITRTAPVGAWLERGFKCKFALGILPGFSIWEFEITPGKLTGGPPINHTTFFNSNFHTQLPQVLVKQEPWKIKGKYDSDIYKGTFGSAASSTVQLPAIINKLTAMTFLLPNLGTLSNYGWVRDVTFGTFREGDTNPPFVELDIEISSWDPVNRVEAGWSYVDGYTGTADT